jgi:hypothetical protein
MASSPTIVTERRVEFDDIKTERAEDFRLFLHIVMEDAKGPRGWPRIRFSPVDRTDIMDMMPILLFLRKWKCTRLFDIALGAIDDSFTRFPLQCFQLASHLDLPDLCARILREVTAYRWGDEEGEDDRLLEDGEGNWVDERCEPANAFQSRNWTVTFWREHEIPAEYMWAMTQAVAQAPGTKDCGERFLSYLDLAK